VIVIHTFVVFVCWQAFDKQDNTLGGAWCSVRSCAGNPNLDAEDPSLVKKATEAVLREALVTSEQLAAVLLFTEDMPSTSAALLETLELLVRTNRTKFRQFAVPEGCRKKRAAFRRSQR
jgi:hypothetical protein